MTNSFQRPRSYSPWPAPTSYSSYSNPLQNWHGASPACRGNPPFTAAYQDTYPHSQAPTHYDPYTGIYYTQHPSGDYQPSLDHSDRNRLDPRYRYSEASARRQALPITSSQSIPSAQVTKDISPVVRYSQPSSVQPSPAQTRIPISATPPVTNFTPSSPPKLNSDTTTTEKSVRTPKPQSILPSTPVAAVMQHPSDISQRILGDQKADTEILLPIVLQDTLPSLQEVLPDPAKSALSMSPAITALPGSLSSSAKVPAGSDVASKSDLEVLRAQVRALEEARAAEFQLRTIAAPQTPAVTDIPVIATITDSQKNDDTPNNDVSESHTTERVVSPHGSERNPVRPEGGTLEDDEKRYDDTVQSGVENEPHTTRDTEDDLNVHHQPSIEAPYLKKRKRIQHKPSNSFHAGSAVKKIASAATSSLCWAVPKVASAVGVASSKILLPLARYCKDLAEMLFEKAAESAVAYGNDRDSVTRRSASADIYPPTYDESQAYHNLNSVGRSSLSHKGVSSIKSGHLSASIMRGKPYVTENDEDEYFSETESGSGRRSKREKLRSLFRRSSKDSSRGLSHEEKAEIKSQRREAKALAKESARAAKREKKAERKCGSARLRDDRSSRRSIRGR